MKISSTPDVLLDVAYVIQTFDPTIDGLLELQGADLRRHARWDADGRQWHRRPGLSLDRDEMQSVVNDLIRLGIVSEGRMWGKPRYWHDHYLASKVEDALRTGDVDLAVRVANERTERRRQGQAQAQQGEWG
jgi:hypothetical protein